MFQVIKLEIMKHPWKLNTWSGFGRFYWLRVVSRLSSRGGWSRNQQHGVPSWLVVCLPGGSAEAGSRLSRQHRGCRPAAADQTAAGRLLPALLQHGGELRLTASHQPAEPPRPLSYCMKMTIKEDAGLLNSARDSRIKSQESNFSDTRTFFFLKNFDNKIFLQPFLKSMYS